MDSLKIGRGFKVLPTKFADLCAETQNVSTTTEASNNCVSFYHRNLADFPLKHRKC